MNKKFFLILGAVFLILAVGASLIEKEYILIEFYYQNGNFHIVNQTLEKGDYPINENEGDFEYEFVLSSDNNDLLYSNSFDPTIIFTDGSNGEYFGGGAIKLSETNFFVIAPNFNNAQKIKIFKDGQKIFEAGVDYNAAKSCRIR